MKISITPNRKNNQLRTPDDKNNRRVVSNDRFIGRSIPSTQPVELPTADINAKYSINYLPGGKDHVIDTGKTLAEAQMKVVMFACEVERLSAQNYDLVRENEVLRVHIDKDQREQDLENKLAIVLAENEKLNQVIEELYNVYTSEKGGQQSNISYERRISELRHDLEEWKHRYNDLHESQGGQNIQNALFALEEENEKLKEGLIQRNRDLETLREKLQNSGNPTGEVRVLEEKIVWLVEENSQLKEDLKASSNPGQTERILREYREKTAQLIAENEHLKQALRLQAETYERKESSVSNSSQSSPSGKLHQKAEAPKRSAVPMVASEVSVAPQENPELKKKTLEAEKLREKVGVLLEENERLNTVIQKQLKQVEDLKAGKTQSADLTAKLRILGEENDKLNNLLREKLEEVDRLRRQNADSSSVGQRVEELNGKIRHLLDRNNELNTLVSEKEREVEELRRRVHQSDSDDFKTKLILVTQENERLNDLLLANVDETDRIKRHFAEFQASSKTDELTLQVDVLKDDNSRLSQVMKEKDRVVEDLRRKVHELQTSGSVNEELKVKLQLIASENERLNNTVVEQLTESDRLRRKATEADVNAMKIQELNRHIETNKADIERASALAVERRNEADKLRAKIFELENSSRSSDELNGKLILITQENDRLNTIVLEKMEEIDRLKRQVIDLQAQSFKVEQLNIQIRNLSEDNDRLRKQVSELQTSSYKVDQLNVQIRTLTEENERSRRQGEETDRLRRQVGDLQANSYKIEQLTIQVKTLTEENEKLRHQVIELQGGSYKVEQLTTQIRGLIDENEKLNVLVLERARETEELRKRILEFHEAARVVEDLKSKLQLITADNEKLNTVTMEKLREVDQLKLQLTEAQSSKWKIEELNRTIETLRLDLTKLNSITAEKESEKEKLRSRIFELESASVTLSEWKSKVVMISGETERLGAQLAEKTTEITSLRQRLSEAELKTYQIDALIQDKERMSILAQENARELNQARDKLTSLELSTYRIKEVEDRLRLANDEKERTNRLLMERVREAEDLRVKLISLEASATVVEDLKARLVLLMAETERLNNTIKEKNSEIEQLIVRVAQGQAEGLRERVEILTAENDKLNVILSERFREVEIWKQRLTEAELSNNTQGLQIQLEALTRELDRSRQLLAEKDNELNTLRRTVIELEVKSGNSYELQTKLSALTTENRRLMEELDGLRVRLAQDRSRELEVKVNDLVNEKEGLNRLLRVKIEEAENLRRELDDQKGGNFTVVGGLSLDRPKPQETVKNTRVVEHDRSGEIELKNRQIVGLEQQLNSSNYEVSRLANLINTKDSEITSLRYQLDAVSRQLQADGTGELLKSENNFLKRSLDEKNRAVEDLQLKLRSNERELANSKVLVNEAIAVERRRSTEENNDLQHKVDELEEENASLKTYLHQALDELEELKKRYEELESLKSQEVGEFRNQFEILKDINQEIRDLQNHSAAERTAYETQLSQLQITLADLEAERDMLVNENERLTHSGSGRFEATDKLQRKVIETEEVARLEILELKSEIEQHKSNTHDIKQLAIKYSADRAADQSHIHQLKQMNENFRAEIDKLYELLDQRKVDMDNLHTQNEELRQAQIKLVTHLKQSVTIEEGSNDERYEMLQNELHELERARNLYREQAERNSVELTRRNKELVDKIQQLDVLKLKYEEAFANYQALNFKLFERLSV